MYIMSLYLYAYYYFFNMFLCISVNYFLTLSFLNMLSPIRLYSIMFPKKRVNQILPNKPSWEQTRQHWSSVFASVAEWSVAHAALQEAARRQGGVARAMKDQHLAG